MDKVKIVVHPRLHNEKPEVMSLEDILETATADWDPNDPGVGRSFYLKDGREVTNPVPFAPPIGHIEADDLMTRMHGMLRQELAKERQRQAAENGELRETADEWRDFPEDTDAPEFSSFYELVEDLVPPEMPPPKPGSPGTPIEEAPAEAPAPPEA